MKKALFTFVGLGLSWTLVGAVSLPESIVIKPSGQRQVYFGWSTLVSTQVKAQKSTDNGTNWADIPEAEIDRRSSISPEMTIEGWSSIRYLNATSGSTAKYRLAFSDNNGTDWTYSAAIEIANPSPILSLHSRHGAKKTIYLDFSGYVDDYKANVASMRYNISSKSSLSYLETPPFSFAGRFANKTKNEIKIQETNLSATYPLEYAIYDIWRMVAEDFMMFDVDVTTVDPGYAALVKSLPDDDTYGKRVIFDCAPDGKWYTGAGGVSGLGAFGFRADRSAYIFGNSSRQNLAAQATHETSHTCGLAHDGGQMYLEGYQTYQNDEWVNIPAGFSEPEEYYTGMEIVPNCKWYPVMGGVPAAVPNSGYYYDAGDFFNQFSNGNYDGATNKEDDDLAVMLGLKPSDREAKNKNTIIDFPSALYPDGKDSYTTRNLSLAEDEAGDELKTAKVLAASGEKELSTTGVIGKHIESAEIVNDVDIFAVALTEPGTIIAKVVPGYLGESEGSSLDAKVELLSASGEVLTANEGTTDESVDFREAKVSFECEVAGNYFIRVSGTNHPVILDVAPEGGTTPWYANAKDNYGSIGPYALSVTTTSTFTAPKGLKPRAPTITVK